MDLIDLVHNLEHLICGVPNFRVTPDGLWTPPLRLSFEILLMFWLVVKKTLVRIFVPILIQILKKVVKMEAESQAMEPITKSKRWQSYIEFMLEALNKILFAIRIISPSLTDQVEEMLIKIGEVTSQLKTRKFAAARFTMLANHELAKRIGNNRGTDPTVNGQCAAFLKQYNSVMQNAFDCLIKESNAIVVPMHSPWTIDPAIKNMMKHTPWGIYDMMCKNFIEQFTSYQETLSDFESIFKLEERVYHTVSVETGVDVDLGHENHKNKNCLYCNIGLMHCGMAPYKYRDCCDDHHCVARHDIVSLVCNHEILELQKWHLNFIQHYKFCQFYAECEAHGYSFPIEDDELPTDERSSFEYPDLSMTNVFGMTKDKSIIQAACHMYSEDYRLLRDLSLMDVEASCQPTE